MVDAQGKAVPDGSGKLQYRDLDFNGNLTTTDTVLTADMATLKLLPVSIEVYWKSNGGITSLKYRYVFFKDPLK